MAAPMSSPVSVKVLGDNGQISFCKQLAGRQVLMEEQAAGVWLIRTATAVPDNEGWPHASAASPDLSHALS